MKQEYIKDMNFNLLRSFKAVAENESFVEASRAISVTQPAISKAIKKLESDLNVKLIYKSKKKTVLTPEGQMLYESIIKVHNILKNTIEKMEDKTKKYITIGIQSHYARFFLLNRLSKIMKDNPAINIKLVDAPSKELVRMLDNFEVDFIIDSMPVSISDDMILKKIAVLNTCFVENCYFSENKKRTKSLITNRAILPLARSSIRTSLEKELQRQKYRIKPILEVETTDLILEAVKRNVGIGFVLKIAADEYIKSGQMKIVDLGISMPQLEICIIVKETYLTKASKELIEKLSFKEELDD